MFSLAPHCKALIGKLLLEICNIMLDVEIMTSHARNITNVWLWHSLIIDLQMRVVVFLKWSAKYYMNLQCTVIFFRRSNSSLQTASLPQQTTYYLQQQSIQGQHTLPVSHSYSLKDPTQFTTARIKRARGSSFEPCTHTLANTLGLTDNVCRVLEELCQRFYLMSGIPDLHTLHYLQYFM